jgi:hypothetical protein
MKRPEFSRRQVLASLGVTGVTAVGGLGLATRSSLGFTDSMQMAQTASYTLQADWRETYNGEVLEDTRSTEFTENGAVISLPNVLPGDSGTFSFQLALDADDNNLTVRPRLSLNLTGTAENDVNEVEQSAGDDTPDTGELQDFLSVKLWYDEGVFDVDPFGGENAIQDPGENLIDTDTDTGADGTLADVADAVNDVPLNANGCLGTDQTLTVSFAWVFDDTLGNSNVAQGDSVTFDFEITAERCN